MQPAEGSATIGLRGASGRSAGAPYRKGAPMTMITPSMTIEHVYAETPLRQHVVAALTRFPVPRPD